MSHHFRSLIVLTVLASAVPVAAQRASITGSVTYRERIALPPSAVVEITLEDVSRADAPADVIARLRQSTPGQPPIPFQLPYDPSRVNARSRYAVRARILDGERVLFTSTTTALVITQGRGTTANLVLQRVASGEGEGNAPRTAPPASTRPLPPVVELRSLPATFTGNIACDGCPATRYELDLFPDDSFYLRMTRPGRPPMVQDDLGSWVLSSDRRMLMLRTSKDTTEVFAIRDGSTLRRVEAGGAGRSTPVSDLKRETSFTPLDLRVTVSGAFVRTADAGRLVECSTGQSWNISADSPVRISPAAPASSLGNPVGTFVTATGRLQTSRRPADSSANFGSTFSPTFVIDRLEPSAASSCPARFASLPLVGTFWKLTSLGSTPVSVADGTRNEPSITFRDEVRTFSGTGGCNRLAGRYQIGADTLLMIPAGTMMACAAGGEHEAAFGKALASTRRYVILGTTLELFDETNASVARFEGRP